MVCDILPKNSEKCHHNIERRNLYLKYKEISELWGNIQIEEEGFWLQSRKEKRYLVMYQIFPVVLLEEDIEKEEQYLQKYKAFLKECEFPFQIMMQNQKLDTQTYLEKIASNSEMKHIKQRNMVEAYIKDFKEKLEREPIYEVKYYLIFSLHDKKIEKINQREHTLEKMKQLGCQIEKIKDKSSITNLLYHMLHLQKGSD